MLTSIVLLNLTLPSALPPSAVPRSWCTCASARRVNGWCRSCKVGYVADVAIRSWVLFDALDPYGHDVIAEELKCPGCREAVRSDGFCATCQFGYVGGKLYFSALTYTLGKGQAQDPGALTCATCRRHASATGWCDLCNRGMVGHFAFKDRDIYEVAAREYQRLLSAVQTAQRCEYCAAVMFTGAECVKCKTAEYAREREKARRRESNQAETEPRP